MRSCDRAKSGDPDACEGRNSELPEYAARHIEQSTLPADLCTKCKLAIVLDGDDLVPDLLEN